MISHRAKTETFSASLIFGCPAVRTTQREGDVTCPFGNGSPKTAVNGSGGATAAPQNLRREPTEGQELITNLRTLLAERKIVRQRSRKLAEELASYSTPAERLGLDAILSRHTEAEIAELEALLNHQAVNQATHL